jgi:hypothetical protein
VPFFLFLGFPTPPPFLVFMSDPPRPPGDPRSQFQWEMGTGGFRGPKYKIPKLKIGGHRPRTPAQRFTVKPEKLGHPSPLAQSGLLTWTHTGAGVHFVMLRSAGDNASCNVCIVNEGFATEADFFLFFGGVYIYIYIYISIV